MSTRTPLTLLLAVAATLTVVGCKTTSEGGGLPSIPSPTSSPSVPSVPSVPSTPSVPSVPSMPAPPSTPSMPAPPSTSTGTQSTGGSADTDLGKPAQTADERRAAVDRRFDESLGKFDETMRSEQERAAAERDARTAAGAGAGVETESAESAATRTAQAGGRPGDLKSDKAPTGVSDGSGKKGEGESSASAGTGGSGASAKERPDGSDDDIIARRLRKAAEQETDPELQEKLWKEYADYKASVQGRS